MIIDSHHHFWHYTIEEYGWIGDDVLRRNYLPDEFAVTLKQNRVDCVITIQSRQSETETRWLLELARKHAEIAAVVGWVPLTSADVETVLNEFAADLKFRGVRHVLQGEADDAYMMRDDFRRGIAALSTIGLTYDLLILPRHLANAIQLVDAFPDQIFVLDHLAKPLEGAGFDRWAVQLRELADRPNVYCKISGGAFEIDPRQATLSVMQPYFDVALEAFTPQRLMFGSNWPLTEVAGGYANWLTIVQTWATQLFDADRDCLFNLTASAAYGLSPQ